MAVFLLIAGLTGSIVAWEDELDAWLAPELWRAEAPVSGAPLFSPLELRERVQAQFPEAWVNFVPLTHKEGDSFSFWLDSPPGSHSGEHAELPNDQIFINPYTGIIQGERLWGDISQGLKNLIPFIDRLHDSLALGAVGSYIFGIVALLWTIDCFVGVYLTFPARRRKRMKDVSTTSSRSWLTRWWIAWKIRWCGGSYKLNFDLHRAGSLWVWAMLFVLAWSTVKFNLNEVYDPVMEIFFTYQTNNSHDLPKLETVQPDPAIGWPAALQRGRELMAVEAQTHDFTINQETFLIYNPHKALLRYRVHSSLDIRSGGATQIYFDAQTGERRAVYLPSGKASGDTINQWLYALHMAQIWGLPMKIFVCVMGLVIAMLSVTGVVIWWKKRRARKLAVGRISLRHPPS